ncbi:MAG: hypothetical protein AAF716_12145 [Cyanobacteria bacterium P01_D01_bin.1]
MTSTIASPTASSALIAIQGEPAVPLEHMPKSWQKIALGNWMSEPKVYTAMAQVFLAKHQQGHVLFCERPESAHLKAAYCEGNGQLAYEAVEHYGEAFLPSSYPDFVDISQKANAASNLASSNLASSNLASSNLSSHSSNDQHRERLALIDTVSDLFDELGYDVPATFYWTFLHPLQRTDLFELRSFRFSEQDLGIARAFDAILHGGYVSMLRRLIDSISSQHGYFIEHGCGCDNHLAKLKRCDTPFDYQIPAATRKKTLRAFFWSIMEEYLLFEQRAATRLVYADSMDF